MIKQIIFLALSITFNVLANYTVKAYATQKGQTFKDMLFNIPLYVAIAFFGMNFIFYTKALEELKISVAYPIVVGSSIVLIFLLSYLFLHERLALVQILGLALIIIGVILIYIKM